MCQGTIVGSTDDWDLNARAVRSHNDSVRHKTDPAAAAIRARMRRAERRVLSLEVKLVRARKSPYSPGVSAGALPLTPKVPDNGGVSQPHIEDPSVSLAQPVAS